MAGSWRSATGHRVRRPWRGAGSLVLLVGLGVGCASGSADSGGPPPGPTVPSNDPTTVVSSGEGTPSGAPALLGATAPRESRPVAPRADSGLAVVRRDCGFSVPLPAGGALWVYCDTTEFGSDDRLRWFVNTSAALATDEEPLVMLDHEAPDGRVEPFLEPDAGYPVCGDGEGRFTWPMSGVLVEGSDQPVVAVWYHNVCVVPGAFEGQDAGLAVFEPPAAAPDGDAPASERPILRGEVVDDRIIPDPPDSGPFGQAAVRVDDLVYLYRCPRSSEPCEVARVPADLVAVSDRARYEVWAGTGWAPHGSDGSGTVPMEMPGSRRGLKPSVAWVEDLGVFVYADNLMVDPGIALVRVARSPWGPWSPPIEVDLPGCDGSWPDICFALEIHAELSSDGEIALTWFDPAFARGVEPPLRFARVGLDVDGS